MKPKIGWLPSSGWGTRLTKLQRPVYLYHIRVSMPGSSYWILPDLCLHFLVMTVSESRSFQDWFTKLELGKQQNVGCISEALYNQYKVTNCRFVKKDGMQ
ncbi:MAG: hypothetical protein D0528_08210 [Methylococcales bacterium]|nr:MAG: hypothetical protein D0528_08210 [Methylococcales bacterium]